MGIEATGLVEEIGERVTGLEVGTRVILLGGDLWSEFVIAEQDDVVALPPDFDPQHDRPPGACAASRRGSR